MPASDPAGPDAAAPRHRLATTVLLALAHAALTVVIYEPLNLWPLALVAPLPLIWLAIGAATTRRAVVAVALAQLPAWLILHCWIIQVTAAGYPLLALYMCIYPAAAAWLIRRLHRHVGAHLPLALIVPVVWTAIEFARGAVVFNGYAWYLLGHPLIAWLPLVQSADLLGSWFASTLAAAVAGALADVLLAWRGRRAPRRAAVVSAAVVTLLVANLAYGAWRMSQTAVLRPGPGVLVIQTNLPQDNKIGWPLEQQRRDVPGFFALTREALAACGGEVDLVVWPETMLPGLGLEPATLALTRELGEEYAHLWRWGEDLAALAREHDVAVLVGSSAWVDAAFEPVEGGMRLRPGAEYNSVYLVAGDPPYQRYDKYFLTPFGETMPYISAWPWLEQKLLALGAPGMSFSLASNPDLRLLRLPWNGEELALATPICFEDTVPSVCRRMVHRAGRPVAAMLLNLSNDGWFGWFDAARAQHNQIARFRCIENRVPMVRSVNTGQSVSIDSRGKVIAAIGPGRYGEARRPGWLLAAPPLDDRHAMYGRLGDAWGWGCVGLSLALLVFSIFRRGGERARRADVAAGHRPDGLRPAREDR